MDPGRPKNQSSQNQTKPMPLRRARRADSDHIFFFSENGHRMQKLSRSEDQVKHAKKKSKSKSTGQSQRMTSAVHHDDINMTHGSTRG
jgi:hypothetical protein